MVTTPPVVTTPAATVPATPVTRRFQADLTLQQELPVPTAPANARGRFTATLTGSTLRWTLTFAHLSGPATAAEIRLAARGAIGPTVVSLCGPCSSPANGSMTLTSSEIAGLLAGTLYVNLHTQMNVAGELRGQIKRTS